MEDDKLRQQREDVKRLSTSQTLLSSDRAVKEPAQDVMDSLHQVFTRNGISSYIDHPKLAGDVIHWACDMYRQSKLSAAEGLIASLASQTLDVNDGGSGEAAYCHHRHHFDEGHSSNFDTCPHSICVNARRVAEVPSPARPSELQRIRDEQEAVCYTCTNGSDPVYLAAVAIIAAIDEVTTQLAVSAAPQLLNGTTDHLWARIRSLESQVESLAVSAAPPVEGDIRDHIDAESGDAMLAIRNIVCHLNMLLTDEQKAAINWHPQQSVSIAVMRIISCLGRKT